MTTTVRGRVQAAASCRDRPPRRRGQRLSLLGVPVTTLISLEIIAGCALLLAAWAFVLAAAAVIVIVAAATARHRSIRIGTWAVLGTGYLLRERETLVAAAEYAGGRRPTATRADLDHVDLAPEVEAFFPGMSVSESRTHDGERMGIVHWRGTCAATVRIGASSAIVHARNTTDTVPLEQLMAALDGHDLGLDSVQVLIQTIVGERDPGLTPLLAAAAAELDGGRARVRNRSAFVTVRLDPCAASTAVGARGGGNAGIARVLSVALNRVRAAAAAHGLDVDVLDADAAARAIAASFYHQVTPYDPIIRWVESVRHVTSTRMAHGSFVLADLNQQALAQLPIGDVFGYALGVQAKPLDGGGWSTRTVLRLSCRSTHALDSAGRELRAAARRSGVTLRPLDTVQRLGLRATVPIGGI